MYTYDRDKYFQFRMMRKQYEEALIAAKHELDEAETEYNKALKLYESYQMSEVKFQATDNKLRIALEVVESFEIVLNALEGIDEHIEYLDIYGRL